jgi:hypothetical protein
MGNGRRVMYVDADRDADGVVGVTEFKTAMRKVAVEAIKEKELTPGKDDRLKESVAAIKAIVVYLVFMVLFTLDTATDLTDDRHFYFAENLKQQFIGVEMQQQFSPTWGKTFQDVATVEEYYHWLQSAFSHSAFSPNTFDGSVRRPDVPAGSTMGHNIIIGAVRIAQLRSKPAECASVDPRIVQNSRQFRCYGDPHGEWTDDSEATAAFGAYSPPNTTLLPPGAATVRFARDGVYGRTGMPAPAGTVELEREMPRTAEYSKRLHATYSAPTHAVLLDPRDGLAVNHAVLQSLTAEGADYIDLHTRVSVRECG